MHSRERTSPHAPPKGGDLIKRHRLSTRAWHWINFATFMIMLMSGLMIFNAHPRLYWGEYGANFDPAWLEIGSQDNRGYLKLGAAQMDTTGVLGIWEGDSGRRVARAFPDWATIPSNYSLAVARRWHLTFAWVFVGAIAYYLIWGLFNGHLRHNLIPRLRELRPANIWQDVKNHALLRLPKGAEAARYHVLQKLSYASVVVVMIPLMVLTGLTMSPTFNAIAPWLLDLFGGRQSARSIHFIVAFALIAFVIVHLAMVLLSGPFNQLRAMITGRFRLPKAAQDKEHSS